VSCQIPNKGVLVDQMAPDFTVGCLEYDENIVARVTCGLVAPLDKSLIVIGDEGQLVVENVRRDAGPVLWRRERETGWRARVISLANRVQRRLDAWFPASPWSGKSWRWTRRLPLVAAPRGPMVGPGKPVDFCRGPAELASAIRENRSSVLSAALGLHLVELVEALQHPERLNGRKELRTSF
jgi:hypothetical protein